MRFSGGTGAAGSTSLWEWSLSQVEPGKWSVSLALHTGGAQEQAALPSQVEIPFTYKGENYSAIIRFSASK